MKLSSIALALPVLLIPGLASAEVLSVKTASANFRVEAHEASKIKFSADRFFPVEVVERKKGWVKVKDFEGDVAWVAEKVLGKDPTIVISSDRANIRETPSTTGDVLFKVERGEVFKIEERKDAWLKVVDTRGDGGWIRGDMTWGDPLEAAKEKPAAEAKPAGAEKAKPMETEKAKPSEAASKAKEASSEKAAPAEAEIEVRLMKPEYVRALCESYVHFVWEGEVAPPSDLEILCRALLKSSTPHKAEKVEKPGAESTKKSAPPKAEKKAEKPPAAKPKADKKKQKKK